MLIKALCDYADKHEGETNVPAGWSEQEIHFRIMLNPDGTIENIVDVRIEESIKIKGNKEKKVLKPRKIRLPERTQKTSIDSNLIEHRPLYIFGLNYEKESFSTEDKTEKARKSHEAFVKHELDFFADLDSEIAMAYRNFVMKWRPESETQNKELLKLGKQYNGAYFGFSLAGARGNLEDDEQLKAKYEQQRAQKSEAAEGDREISMCGILGEMLPIARIHDKIKLPGGNSTGCVLVGMKESAFESYGKSQSYNSNVSERAMKKYTATLNRLLEDKRHRVLLDDMVITFFAMKKNDDRECDFFSGMFAEGDKEKEVEASLQHAYLRACEGIAGDEQATEVMKEMELDEEVEFYVVGLTPNSSRICQKFLYRNKFGTIINNLAQHQNDLRIAEYGARQVYFSAIKKELLSPKAASAKIPPPLLAGIMTAALHGTDYPLALLETVIRRIKTDSNEEDRLFVKLNNTRVGVIKACINRRLRNSGKKEEITVALNLENDNTAYLCGRLFAVYEKIQQEASKGGLNRTILDTYFSSACSRPAAILPKLDKLAKNHLKIIDRENGKRAIWFKNLIGEIMDKLEDAFPQTLDLESQGRFIIGYYQQNKALYTPNSKEIADGSTDIGENK